MSDIISAQTLFAEALKAHQLGDFETAQRLYFEALRYAPDRPSIVANLATALFQLERFEAARDLCLDVLTRQPDDAALWVRLGNAQSRLQQHKQALSSYERALSINDGEVEALTNAAHVLESLGRADESLAQLDRALKLAPDHLEARNNRGNVLADLDHFDEAIADYRRAQSANPDDPLAPWNEALCRLYTGDFPGGWSLYHNGWAAGQRGSPLELPQPKWDGQTNIATLLVWGEQGIGDQILFSSLLNDLSCHVARLVVALDDRLLPTFRRSFPCILFISLRDAAKCSVASHQIAIGDLGKHLRPDAASFRPQPDGFLRADPALTAALRANLCSDGKYLCGLSWSSHNPRLGRFKSLGDANLSALAEIPGVRWIDLQYGDTHEDRKGMLTRWGLELTHLDDIDSFRDIDTFAALVSACDQVVSVSNSTVHIAGALGVPVQVMLPKGAGRIWYWHHNRCDSPWYSSCRLLRQHTPGDWQPVIDAVARKLRSTLNKTDSE